MSGPYAELRDYLEMKDCGCSECEAEARGRVLALDQAIAAERERCAKIAEAHPGACQTGCDTGEEIAAKIRSGQ